MSTPDQTPTQTSGIVTKSMLPATSRTFNDEAEDLLSRFPGVDRAALLKSMIGHAFIDLKYGNKREERAACDLLNLVQRLAINQTKP